jgi:membrane protein insertase Oxa1/YidC/SpoIIIJ
MANRNSNSSKPDSLLATLAAVGRISLVIIGLIGLSVEIFRDNGWLNKLLGKLFSSSVSLAIIPIAILVIYFVNRWLSSASDGKASVKGDLPLYLMMAIGAFFLFNLITTGSF